MSKFKPGWIELGWAKFVSDIVSPPVVWGLLAYPIAARNAPSSQEAFWWATLYFASVAVIPVLYILLQVRRGNIEDMHLPNREERIRPFVISTITCAGAAVLMYAINASSVMKVFVLSSLLQIALMAAITTMWQISVHGFSTAGAVVTAGTMFGVVVALVMLPLIPIVGIARLKLKRHTRAQVIAGVAVGAISVGIVFALAGVIEPGIWARR